MSALVGVQDFSRLSPNSGRRILIVGGCGGIGRPLVKACAEMGLEVAVFALQRSIDAHPVPEGVIAFAVDAADDRSVKEGLSALTAHWDSVDILVFLVGFMSVPPSTIEEMPIEEWDAIAAGNLRSAFMVSAATLPLLNRGKEPNIVMVGSSLAYNPISGESAYAAAKAGLVALTKSLAIENAPKIRANLVAPSAIETAFLAGGGGERGIKALNSGGDEWFRKMSDAYVTTIPMRRIAQPEDIVGPILFLAGPTASFITGQVIHVNGGRLTP